jgi:hypothetical protein
VTDRPLRSVLTSTATRGGRRRGAMIPASGRCRARSRSGPHGSDAGSTPAAEASAGAPRLCGEIIGTVDPCKEGRAHRGLSTRSSPSSSSNSGGPPRRGAILPRRFCGRVFIQPGFRGCRSTPPGGAVEIVLTEGPSKSSSPAVDALDSNGQFALRRIVRTEIGCRPPLWEKGPNGVVPGPPRARLAPSMSSQRRVNLPPPARSGCARRRHM